MSPLAVRRKVPSPRARLQEVSSDSLLTAQKSIDEIKKRTGKDDIHFIHVELGDLDACRKAGEEVLSKEQELDILVNNGYVRALTRTQLALTIEQRRHAQQRRLEVAVRSRDAVRSSPVSCSSCLTPP